MILLWACFLGVFASVIAALHPMRFQYVPRRALLLAAPARIFWIGSVIGWCAAGHAIAAFVSMYRNPLHYVLARARGLQPELPK